MERNVRRLSRTLWMGLLGIIGIMAGTVIALTFVALSSEPAPASANTFVHIAPAVNPTQTSTVPEGVRTYDVITSQTTNFNYAGGYVILSTCNTGDCWLTYDDGIDLKVTSAVLPPRFRRFHFYTSSVPPLDVTTLFELGDNTIQADLVDLMGPFRGTNVDFYLVVLDSPPPFPTLRVEPAPFGSQFYYPWLFNRVSRDPVNTFTGDFSYSFTDIAIAGRGLCQCSHGHTTAVTQEWDQWGLAGHTAITSA